MKDTVKKTEKIKYNTNNKALKKTYRITGNYTVMLWLNLKQFQKNYHQFHSQNITMASSFCDNRLKTSGRPWLNLQHNKYKLGLTNLYRPSKLFYYAYRITTKDKQEAQQNEWQADKMHISTS